MMTTTTEDFLMSTTPGRAYLNIEEGDYVIDDVGQFCPDKSEDPIAILLLIISIIGVIGNLIVIYILVVLKEYQKSVTNVYVLQMAVSDLGFTITLLLSNVKGERFKLSNFNCKIVESARMVSYYTSVLFLAVMSLDRYLAVNHALSAKAAKLRTHFSAMVISLVVWVGCFLFDIPVIVYATSVKCNCALKFPDWLEEEGDYYEEVEDGNGTEIVIDDEAYGELIDYRVFQDSYEQLEKVLYNMSIKTCNFGNTNLTIFVTINFVVFFILPLSVTVFCYINIIRKIRSMATIGSNQSAALIKRKRVTNMVILMVTAFVVCWLPFHMHNIVKAKGMFLSKKKCEIFKECITVLAFTNSVLNPLLYTFLGTNFRTRCQEVTEQFRRLSATLGSCGKKTTSCAVVVTGPCPSKTRTTQAQITTV